MFSPADNSKLPDNLPDAVLVPSKLLADQYAEFTLFQAS